MGSCPETDFDLKFVVPMTGLVTSILENEESQQSYADLYCAYLSYRCLVPLEMTVRWVEVLYSSKRNRQC